MTPFPNGLRRLTVLTATVATVAVVLAVAGPTSHARAAQPATTTAELTYNGTAVRVKVDSPRRACEQDRRVFFVARAGQEGGAATAKTNDNGAAQLPLGSPPEDVKLLAYAGRTPDCRLAQSNVLTVQGTPLRAAAKARTSARLTVNGPVLRVKVSSPKAACVKNRKVDVVFYSPSEPFGFGVSGTTDSNGVFRPTLSRSSGIALNRAVAFVRTTSGCNVGQSNTVSNPSA